MSRTHQNTSAAATKKLGTDELIAGIADIVADYRQDDGVQIGAEDVATWVDQFDRADRKHVLRETHAVLSARYYTREETIAFLDTMVRRFAKDFSGGSVKKLLAETAFIDVQEEGKSQKAMLALLDEVIAPHGVSVVECGGKTPKRYVYLDDVLCTGNTAFHDMRDWWLDQDSRGLVRQDALPADVQVLYVFMVLHGKNWLKLCARFRHNHALIQRTAPNTVWRGIAVENTIDVSSALDFVFPRREGLSDAAETYFKQLNVAASEVFRPNGWPTHERLFTSSEGRDAFERALVTRGLDIIGSVGTHKENMRPLGYTLPSQKSLGFGALAFTWRNVPNNSPLVFWHDSPIWTPLFKKRSPTAADDFSTLFGAT